MNRFLSIASSTFLLISCFSQKEGMIKYYNYCSNPIKVVLNYIPDNQGYEKEFTLDSNQSKKRPFLSQNESSIKNNIFFIEENNKNFFYVESYGGSRYSFIACAEKAKQSSIWNWTKSN